MYVLVECLNQKSHNFATLAELTAFVLSCDTATGGLVKDLVEVIAKHRVGAVPAVTTASTAAEEFVPQVAHNGVVVQEQKGTLPGLKLFPPSKAAAETVKYKTVESLPPPISAESLKADSRGKENPTKVTKTITDPTTGQTATITVYGGPPGPVSADDAKKPAPKLPNPLASDSQPTNDGPVAFDWDDDRHEQFEPVAKSSNAPSIPTSLSKPNPEGHAGYPDLQTLSVGDAKVSKLEGEKLQAAIESVETLLGISHDSPIVVGKPFGEPSENVETAAAQHFLYSCFGINTVGKSLSWRDARTHDNIRFAWMLFLNHPEYFGDESASLYKLDVAKIKAAYKADAGKLETADALYRCWKDFVCWNPRKLGFFIALSNRLFGSEWVKDRFTSGYANNMQTNLIGDKFLFNNFGHLLYTTAHLIASIADNSEKKNRSSGPAPPTRQGVVDMWVTFFASCNLRSGVSSMISSSDLFQSFTKWMEAFYDDVNSSEPGSERTNIEMEIFRGLFRIQSFGSAVRSIGIESTRRSSGMFYKDVGYLVPRDGIEEGAGDDGKSVKSESVKSGVPTPKKMLPFELLDKPINGCKLPTGFVSSELLPIEKAPDAEAMEKTVVAMMKEREPPAVANKADNTIKAMDALIKHRNLSLASLDIRGEPAVAPLGEMTLSAFGLS